MPHRPPHHRKHEWIRSEEKTRSLKDVGDRLQKIGSLLVQKGYFTLGGTEIKPPDPCEFILRYERMPRGELSLKIELLWDEQSVDDSSASDYEDLSIE